MELPLAWDTLQVEVQTCELVLRNATMRISRLAICRLGIHIQDRVSAVVAPISPPMQEL